jgi:hypothetical protein
MFNHQLTDIHYNSSSSSNIENLTISIIISGLLTSVGKASREALILKESTKIVENLSVNYDTSVVLNFHNYGIFSFIVSMEKNKILLQDGLPSPVPLQQDVPFTPDIRRASTWVHPFHLTAMSHFSIFTPLVNPKNNEISPRQAAEYHVFRILLTIIAASCGELNPGEIK